MKLEETTGNSLIVVGRELLTLDLTKKVIKGLETFLAALEIVGLGLGTRVVRDWTISRVLALHLLGIYKQPLWVIVKGTIYL